MHQELLKCANDSSLRQNALKVIESKLTESLPSSSASPKSTGIYDCYRAYFCPTISQTEVHPREMEACEEIHSRNSITNWVKSFFVPPEWKDVEEFLRFRADDPREKVLFLSAEGDHNGALSPSKVGGILSQLSQKFDLSYRIVRSVDEVRRAISSAAKTGKLAHVILSGHGHPERICLSDCDSWPGSRMFRDRNDFDSIFGGVQPNGKIILVSCSVGAEKDQEGNSFKDKYGKFVNLAQKIADAAKRTVVAPTDSAYPVFTSLLSTDTAMLYHPENRLFTHIPFYNYNLFRLFKPDFKDCSDPFREMKSREFYAHYAVYNDLNSKHLIPEDEKLSKLDTLKLCKDDPREKILYFSSDYAKNKGLDPEYAAGVLGVLADKFDLRYQVVSSIEDVCSKVDKAAEFGEIAGVIIASHGTPSEGLELSKDGRKVTAQYDFSKCFSKVKDAGTIILSGGSVGQNSTNPNNLAQKIANDSGKTVMAPTCTIYQKDVEIRSIDPLIVHQSKWSDFANYFIGCPENNENLFKTFKPKK